MAEGYSAAEAIALLEDLASRALYMKLHVGAPGPNGTANAAVETTRVAVTWGTPVLDGLFVVMTHTNALEWVTVDGSEDYSHASFWSQSTGGTFRCSGLITASAVMVGDNWTLPIGAYLMRLPVAS